MSIQKIKIGNFIGNTIIGAAAELFGIESKRDYKIDYLRRTITVKGTVYDWWKDGNEFCFLKAE